MVDLSVRCVNISKYSATPAGRDMEIRWHFAFHANQTTHLMVWDVVSYAVYTSSSPKYLDDLDRDLSKVCITASISSR